MNTETCGKLGPHDLPRPQAPTVESGEISLKDQVREWQYKISPGVKCPARSQEQALLDCKCKVFDFWCCWCRTDWPGGTSHAYSAQGNMFQPNQTRRDRVGRDHRDIAVSLDNGEYRNEVPAIRWADMAARARSGEQQHRWTTGSRPTCRDEARKSWPYTDRDGRSKRKKRHGGRHPKRKCSQVVFA